MNFVVLKLAVLNGEKVVFLKPIVYEPQEDCSDPSQEERGG